MSTLVYKTSIFQAQRSASVLFSTSKDTSTFMDQTRTWESRYVMRWRGWVWWVGRVVSQKCQFRYKGCSFQIRSKRVCISICNGVKFTLTVSRLIPIKLHNFTGSSQPCLESQPVSFWICVRSFHVIKLRGCRCP